MGVTRKKGFKTFVALLMIMMLALSMTNLTSEAASKKNGLKKVKITKVTKEVSQVAAGVMYTFKWKKVKGANGYQVKLSSREAGEWFNETSYTSGRSFKTGGSSIDTYRIKVRAYKVVNNKKKYGPWSKVKEVKVF